MRRARVHVALATAGLFVGALLAFALQFTRPFPPEICVTLGPPDWNARRAAPRQGGRPWDGDLVFDERTGFGLRSTLAEAPERMSAGWVRTRAPAGLWEWWIGLVMAKTTSVSPLIPSYECGYRRSREATIPGGRRIELEPQPWK